MSTKLQQAKHSLTQKTIKNYQTGNFSIGALAITKKGRYVDIRDSQRPFQPSTASTCVTAVDAGPPSDWTIPNFAAGS
ncbi:MAG TPA: hypothetical protein EYP88_06355 [Anaerolineales bacterium]|nr:hypothetical protein [Anaerolineales bacterium]